MNKRIIYIAALISMTVVLGSCKKFLTEESLTQVSASSYFNSLNDINAALAGVYTSFQYEMRSNYHYWGELRSDNFERSSYGGTAIKECDVNALSDASGNSANDWTGLYRTIGRANTCIKYAPKAAEKDYKVTPTKLNQVLAECYAMRAMSYFYIVRVWGDAPVRVTPYEDYKINPRLPRVSQYFILDSVIIPDLLKAYDLFPRKQSSAVWTISEGAICAALADVYMWKAGLYKYYKNPVSPDSALLCYNTATTWFNNLFLAKGPTGKQYAPAGTPATTDLNLWATWNTIFTTPLSSIESIWNIYWDAVGYNYSEDLPISSNGNGSITATKNNPVGMDNVWMYPYYTTKDGVGAYYDLRGPLTMNLKNTSASKYQSFIKFYPTGITDALAELSYNQYLPMYRMSDIVLLYAEALDNIDSVANKQNVIDMINLVRNRSDVAAAAQVNAFTKLTVASVPDNATLVNLLLNERHYELCGEGKRWFDLVRNGKVNEVMDPVLNERITTSTITYTDGFGSDQRKIWWPLRRSLIDDSEGVLKQTDGY